MGAAAMAQAGYELLAGLRPSARVMARALNPCCCVPAIVGLKLVLLHLLVHLHTLHW